MTETRTSLELFRERARELSARFARQRDHYRAPSYNEETARSEFISPLFEALGWDVANHAGNAFAYRDVVHEEGIKVGDATKAPDYTFRIGGQRKFFVEAKKPGVDLKGDPAPAYQLRRYAWSAKLPLSILTDFEELAVYDTRIRPKEGDKPSVARVFYFRHDEYEPRAAEIWNVFAKRAVLEGSFDAYAEDNRRKRGTSEVDSEFLKEIEGWREELAKNFALRNAGLSVDELNYAVQATIDRILFLRIAEGRGAEAYGRLLGLTNAGAIYERLTALYREADERYNSGLFDFAADRLTLGLAIDDKVLKPILAHLYYPQSPYEFSVLPPEILGNVYEQFLGKVIRLTAGGRAKVEEKPEVKKAGGVYYTPTYIVDYIVEHTVGEQVKGKSPKEMAKLRVLDPACGSGSFLLVAYQKLLDAHLAWYREHEPKRHKDALFEGPGGEWRLTTAEKRKILVQSIFGVDIDRQAVEVTKLSLLLKCLEGETNETLRQMNLYGERALPSLEKNIQCGNSLISPQALLQHTGGLFPDEAELRRINPFDWHKAFPEVFAAGGFDTVIGNPPWLMAGYHLASSIELLRKQFQSARGKFDLYYVFIEKGLGLTRDDGLFGMIVPNKFLLTEAARELRTALAEARVLHDVVDFGIERIFRGATNYSCLLFARKGHRRTGVRYSRAKRDLSIEYSVNVPFADLGEKPWTFEVFRSRGLFEKLAASGCTLDQLTERFGTGVQSGADRILTLAEEQVSGAGLAKEFFRPTLRGRDVRRYHLSRDTKMLFFPYREVGGAFELLPEKELRKAERTFEWLEGNRRALEARLWFGKGPEELSGAWYGLMYVDGAEFFSKPHLLTPSLAARSEFARGDGRLFATGTAGVTSIVLHPSVVEFRIAILAILNSSLLSFWVRANSPKFQGSFVKFSAPYLRRMPLPPLARIRGKSAADLSTLGAQLEALWQSIHRNRTQNDTVLAERQISTCDAEIDRLVYELYELTPEEIAVVEKG